MGHSPAPAGLLRPWCAAGGPRSIPGYAAAPGGARRVPGGAPGPSCGVAAPWDTRLYWRAFTWGAAWPQLAC